MKFLSRLVEFKILVNWGMVHSGAVATLAGRNRALHRNRRAPGFIPARGPMVAAFCNCSIYKPLLQLVIYIECRCPTVNPDIYP
jgi:hypothetical protein